MKVLCDFDFKAILPSVQYGLILWDACSNSDLFCSLEPLHCRATRIIFNLRKDLASCDVLERDHWPTLLLLYKMDIFKLFYKAHKEILPDLLSKDIYNKCSNGCYSLKEILRVEDSLLVPRFKTRYTKDSLAYRGATLWNTISLNEHRISHGNQNALYR